ncbi:MAG TPA: TIM barrel protein [Burkholderiales bacterium]
MKRKLGLAALTCLELAPPDLVSAAAAASYDCVGLRLIGVAGQVLPKFEQRELERRLADTGLKVLDVEIFRLDPQTVVVAFEPALAVAQRIGATEILVHGADADEVRLIDSFARLCELAGKYGVRANLEPMPWVEISTVAKAKRIVKGTNGAVLVDAIHFYRADNSFEDLQGAPMRYVQFCDAHPGRPADVQEIIRQARGDRLFPGEGALDLRGLLRALPGDLPLSLEIPVARKIEPFERAKQAMVATRRFLGE